LGKEFSVTRQHGKLVESELAPFTIATVHPSSILRAPDAESRRQQMRALVEDLKQVVVLATKTQAK
jgi:uracil-DNA glycosylase